jgi:pimeloyl-ACP methyl ester carboxylesterase
MTTVQVDGARLGVQSLGRDDDPLVLLAGGPTMLSWPDSLCERIAAAGRRVVRYDLRDSGESTTGDPESPSYRLVDLAVDAAALVRALGAETALLGGYGVGGMVAQVAALDHPDVFSGLVLVATRPVAPGPVDDDLPDHDGATMQALFSLPMPDWTDRAAVAAFAAGRAELLGDDPEDGRAVAARIWGRTPSLEPAVHLANQLGVQFAHLDCTPRWRERLGELAMPTLVVHGRRDPFFPLGNGEALARAIPAAGLLVLDDMGTALRDAAGDEVATAMLAL